MFGIGPMLPVIPAAADVKCSATKSQKSKAKNDCNELAGIQRDSKTKTETPRNEGHGKYAVNEPGAAFHHQRDLSLVVDFDFERAAGQLKNEVISDLDLALFVLWIKARSENYSIAKNLIREVALDQGYNINKIANIRVRQLLQEIYDIRPRDPRHDSPYKSPFHDQRRTPSIRTKHNKYATIPSPMARVDTLPPSLRIKRELAVQEAARPTTYSNDAADYPPNTPDRPEPLSVKSRSSQLSSATPVPNSLLRSVSTPCRTQHSGKVSQDTANTMVMENEARSSSSSMCGRSCGSTDDVFICEQSERQEYCNLSTRRTNNTGDRQHGSSEQYHHNNTDKHSSFGLYRLDSSDIASESSYGSFNNILQKKEKNRTDFHPLFERPSIRNGSFDALEPYIGTEDEDNCSLLDSASTTSGQGAQTQYHYDADTTSLLPMVAGPVNLSSKYRVSAEALRKVQQPSNPASAGINLHRPLPLRMVLTTDAQENSSCNRGKSVARITASEQGTTKMMPLPSLSGLRQKSASPNAVHEGHKEPDVDRKFSEQLDQCVLSSSKRCSDVSTLAAFPIPPMRNPVGELPMLFCGATSLHQSPKHGSSQNATAVALLEGTYHAINRVNMVAVLQRTRARGAQLQTVEWDKLTSFERAWRELNEVLLVTVYGKTDVVLDETDVAYIDCVARELRNDSSGIGFMDWVRHNLEDAN